MTIRKVDAETLTDGFELIDPTPYAESGQPHDVWTALRRESPVHRCEVPGYEPFWAITKHADICEISKQPKRFSNAAGGIVVMTDEQLSLRQDESGLGAMRTIIEMDPPEHRKFRKVASPWFTPRAMSRIEELVETSARELVDSLGPEGECDFATRVATAHPLRILCHILGIPREEEGRVLEMTNQLFGADDPDLQRAGSDRRAAIQELGLEMYQFFSKIIEERRANPGDDLASLLATGTVDGEPMGPLETFGYYLITFTAGHDTTKNSLAGGLHALASFPDELAKLRRDPGLARSAVEEIIRWATPVNYMKRTVQEDTLLRGQKLRKGDSLALFYGSANRDEDVFEDPFRFRIDRDPNPHLGFGIGEHFCLGSHLARRSQQAFFRELARRVETLELAGKPEWIRASFVVGLKRLPIRYRIAAA